MADHSKPTNTSLYTDYTSQIDARFDDITLGLDPAVVTATNLPTGAIRWNSASAKWEKWNGTAWADLATAYNINLAGPITLTANTASDAFRITQTGAGNAFVVEDSANPDSTPFVIDANGNVGIGLSVPLAKLHISGVGAGADIFQSTGSVSAASGATFSQRRDRAGGLVNNGDTVGIYSMSGYDGTNFIEAARIFAQVDGTPGTNDMPGRLVFSTTADGASTPTERLRIDSLGRIGVASIFGTTAFNLRTNMLNSGQTTNYGFRSAYIADAAATASIVGFATTGAIGGAGGSAYTTTNLVHYQADTFTLGANQTITNQYGFNAGSNLTNATNNYGFYSNIASGTGRWNFYANGTAQNYFAGYTTLGSPALINGSGASSNRLQIIGSTFGDSSLGLFRAAANPGASNIVFNKARGAIGTETIALSGDTLGVVNFAGYDGAAYISSASIQAFVDGTPGTNDMPGRIVFSTTPDGSASPTERTRIGSDGTLRHLNDIAFNNATVLTASYDSVSFSVAGQETAPNKVWFRPDGLRMYILGDTGNDITQYTLTTAWDITTAGSPTTFSIGTQEATPSGLYFREDGLKFYILGLANDTVYQYSCGTAWDISTASYDSKSFSVTSQEASPYGLFFKPNGLKMYVVGNTSDTIFEYDLSTAWDVSTAAYNSVSVSVSGFDTNPLDLKFTNDGYKLFIVGNSGDDITEFALSKAWDITTIQRLGEFYVGTQEASPYGMFIKPDLSKFYIVGVGNDTVYQYSMGAGSINLTSDVKVNGKFNVIGTPPAAATSTGKQGDIIWDSGYIYICVANNTWKRSAITTW